MNRLIPAFLCALLALAGCANSDIEGGENNLREGTDAGVDPNGSSDGGDNIGDAANGMSDFGDSPDDMSMADVSNQADMGSSDMARGDVGVDMQVDPMPCSSDPSSQGWEAMGAPLDALGAMTDARVPHIAVDDSCRAIVAFHQSDGTNAPNIFVYRWESGAWNQLGGAIDATGSDSGSTSGVRVATYQDTPYIAWSESGGAENIYVARWDGSTWNQVGSMISNSMNSLSIGFDIDSTERPVVAWASNTGLNTRTQVYVSRYENMNWGELSSPLVNDPASNATALGPDLVIDSQDQPVVMWQEDRNVHARRWEVNGWIDFVGNPIDSGNGNFSAFQARVDVAPNGDIVMGWREATNASTDVFVQRWNGSTFSTIADAVDVEPETEGRTNTLNLTLKVDGQGRTIFAFDEPEIEFAGTTNVHVFRHDSTGLAPLGMGEFDINAGDTSARSPELAVDQIDRAYIAFVEENGTHSEIHVWRYTD